MQEAFTTSPYDWKNNQSEEDQLTMIEEGSPLAKPKPKNDDKSLDSFCVCSKVTEKLTVANIMKQI